MSIQQEPGKKPLVPLPPPPWGETTPEGQKASVVRFVLADRVVTFPFSELKRWEHVAGDPERLKINAGKDIVTVEGWELAAIRTALDLARLVELRPTHERSGVRLGPRVREITIQPA